MGVEVFFVCHDRTPSRPKTAAGAFLQLSFRRRFEFVRRAGNPISNNCCSKSLQCVVPKVITFELCQNEPRFLSIGRSKKSIQQDKLLTGLDRCAVADGRRVARTVGPTSRWWSWWRRNLDNGFTGNGPVCRGQDLVSWRDELHP